MNCAIFLNGEKRKVSGLIFALVGNITEIVQISHGKWGIFPDNPAFSRPVQLQWFY